MKSESKKAWLVGAVRALILVMAYQHLILPKQNALPPGTQRPLWWSLKNAWKFTRLRVQAAAKSLSAQSPA